MEAQLEQLEGDRVRLTVEVPASEVHHAVEHATHDLAERVSVPGFRAGQGAAPGARPADRQRARLRRGGRVAHRQLVLERRAHARACGRRSSPRTTTSFPAGDDEAWSFRPSSRCSRRPSRPTGRRSRCRGSRSRCPTRSSTGSSRCSSRTVASLSPVEGRPARPGDVAVVDIVADDGHGQRTTSSRSAPSACRRDRGRDPAPAARATATRSPGSSATAATQYAVVTLKELYEQRAAAARRRPRHRRVRVRHARRAAGRHRRAHPRAARARRSSAAFRVAAVDELAEGVEGRAGRRSSSTMRTRDLLNAFVRQLEPRGIDPVAYLRADRHQRRRPRAALPRGGRAVDRPRARARGRRRPARRSRSTTTTSAPTCARTARATRTSRSSSRRAAPTASATTCG